MTTLTWKGEDELHNGGAGPSFTTAFGGIKFPKGQAVEVTDPDMIRRAKGNRFFTVSEGEDHSDDLDGMKIAELREMAEAAGIDHTGMSKAELRDALK